MNFATLTDSTGIGESILTRDVSAITPAEARSRMVRALRFKVYLLAERGEYLTAASLVALKEFATGSAMTLRLALGVNDFGNENRVGAIVSVGAARRGLRVGSQGRMWRAGLQSELPSGSAAMGHSEEFGHGGIEDSRGDATDYVTRRGKEGQA